MRDDDDNIILRQVLSDMLEEDVDISASAAAARHPSFRHASYITRYDDRRALIKVAEADQEAKRARSPVPGASKKSRDELVADIAKKAAELAELRSQLDALTTSHRMMIDAVVSVGGYTKLLEFYTRWKTVRDTVFAIPGSMPSADVIPIKVPR